MSNPFEKGYPPILAALRSKFKKLNPNVDLETIDWWAVYDPKLSYAELVEKFAEAYPMYKWREEAKPTKPEEVKDEEEEAISYVRYLTTVLKPNELKEEDIKRISQVADIAAKYKQKYEKAREELLKLKRIEAEERELIEKKVIPPPKEKPITELPEFPFKPPKEREEFYNYWMRLFRGEVE